jgi:hypothetical protein
MSSAFCLRLFFLLFLHSHQDILLIEILVRMAAVALLAGSSLISASAFVQKEIIILFSSTA